MTILTTLLVAAVVAPAAPQEAAALAGVWEGRINVAGQSIRVVFRVAEDGSTTMDSPDQGAFGIAADRPVLEGGTVRIGVPAVGGRFEGALAADGRTLSGALVQGGANVPLVLSRQASVSPLAGAWEGAIDAGGQRLRIVFRVSPDGRAVMDSPDQGARDIPVQAPTLEDGVARFVAPAIGGSVEGRLSEDGRTITGTLRQGAAELPVTLTRTADTADLTRPRSQTPTPPFPYRAEDVSFDNPEAPGVRLAATLTLPQGEGPFPAAILITGTGPQDRDETIEEHKPFAIWADELTRRGVAVLRYDDRGVSGSTGSFPAAAQKDFASDVKAAFAWLAGRPEIDPARIGLIGHSEGATFAELAIQDGVEPAWLVALAGPALSGGATITAQVEHLGRASGMPEEAVARNVALQRRLMETVASHADDADAARVALEPLLRETGRLPAEAAQLAAVMSGDWYRGMVALDPAEAIRALRAPMLAVFGGKDLQVPADPNAAAVSRYKPDAEVVILPGLNHLFQPAETGLPAEYGQIETTLDPAAIRTVVDWVAARSGL